MCSFLPSSVFEIVFKAEIRLGTTRLNLQEYEMKYLFDETSFMLSYSHFTYKHNPFQSYAAVQKTMIVMYEAICSKAVGPKMKTRIFPIGQENERKIPFLTKSKLFVDPTAKFAFRKPFEVVPLFPFPPP